MDRLNQKPAFDVVTEAGTYKKPLANSGAARQDVLRNRECVVGSIGGNTHALPTIPDITRLSEDVLRDRTTHGTILAPVVGALRADGAQPADNFWFVMEALQLDREVMGKVFGQYYNRNAMSGKDVAERFRTVLGIKK